MLNFKAYPRHVLSVRPEEMIFVLWVFLIVGYVETIRGAQSMTAIALLIYRDGRKEHMEDHYTAEVSRGMIDFILGLASLTTMINLGTKNFWIHCIIRLAAIMFYFVDAEYAMDTRVLMETFVIGFNLYLIDVYDEFEWFSSVNWRPFEPQFGRGIWMPWHMPNWKPAVRPEEVEKKKAEENAEATQLKAAKAGKDIDPTLFQ